MRIKGELQSEVPVCKIKFQFCISLARLNSGKMQFLKNSGTYFCKQ